MGSQDIQEKIRICDHCEKMITEEKAYQDTLNRDWLHEEDCIRKHILSEELFEDAVESFVENNMKWIKENLATEIVDDFIKREYKLKEVY